MLGGRPATGIGCAELAGLMSIVSRELSEEFGVRRRRRSDLLEHLQTGLAFRHAFGVRPVADVLRSVTALEQSYDLI